MKPDHWARVTALFDQALGRPAAVRTAWLQQACDDEAIRSEVIALLQTYDTDPDFLEQPATFADATPPGVDPLVGQRLGAYRLERQIGRGGMGVVYEAQRDDRQFDRRAAIKILPVLTAAMLAERFQFERQVLAALDHPGIARLFDAGTTGEGVPYFVMEYVDGQPVDVWCREHQLSVRQRVSVVERICEAVAYAHQHLVVHRDLKPGNILVTSDGAPKLLDFGIATLLPSESGASAGLTKTGHRSFTLDFASPEQVRGEPVSTTSDVYSLGALLYLLLAGRTPHALDHLSPLDAMRTVCEIEPPLMSAVADQVRRGSLRGDLDTVVAKALRRRAAERYGTVAEFAADLRAWREGRPVAAAPASFAYRSRRFAARNRWAVAGAAALLVSVTGGVAATTWQAGVARQERDKARNRFVQVQQFSRALLFDVHDSLRTLPGATEPRRLLLDRAVQFLDGLAADAGDDDVLQMELAEGYRRLGHVQGSAYSDNVGDTGGAAASFEKATRLAEAVRARRTGALDRLLLSLRAHYDLAAVRLARGEQGASEIAKARHLALVQELEQRHAHHPEARAAAAVGYSNQGVMHATRRDLDGARPFYAAAVKLYESLPPDHPSRHEHRADYSQVLKRLGAVLMVAEDFAESERHYRVALGLDDEAIRRDPGNLDAHYTVTFSLSDLGLVVSRQGRDQEATALWLRAMAIRRAALDHDPRNVRAMSGVATLLNRLGGVAAGANDHALALQRFREELRLRQALITALGGTPAAHKGLAFAQANVALNLIALAKTREARQAARDRDEARALARSIEPDRLPKPGTAGFDPEFATSYAALMAALAGR